jgi:transcription elongation factor GreA
MSSDRIPMTRVGYEKLKAEVDHLNSVEMPRLAQQVAAARSEGDLSENAEYHGARESQGMMQAKINVLADKLARAVIVERPKEATDEVVFGSTVVVKDLKFGVGDGNLHYYFYNWRVPEIKPSQLGIVLV